MNVVLLLAAWTIASFPLACFVGRILAHNTPSPCERDAQDGRGEGGEGAGAFHSQPTKTILEQDHA